MHTARPNRLTDKREIQVVLSCHYFVHTLSQNDLLAKCFPCLHIFTQHVKTNKNYSISILLSISNFKATVRVRAHHRKKHTISVPKFPVFRFGACALWALPTFSNYRHCLSSNDTIVSHLIHSTATQIPLLLVKYYDSNKTTLEKQYHSTTTQILYSG